ncbi:unnamed protein product [Coccothraustes coccothraustes]
MESDEVPGKRQPEPQMLRLEIAACVGCRWQRGHLALRSLLGCAYGDGGRGECAAAGVALEKKGSFPNVQHDSANLPSTTAYRLLLAVIVLLIFPFPQCVVNRFRGDEQHRVEEMKPAPPKPPEPPQITPGWGPWLLATSQQLHQVWQIALAAVPAPGVVAQAQKGCQEAESSSPEM